MVVEPLVSPLLAIALAVAAGALWGRFARDDVAALRGALSRLTLHLFAPALLFAIAAEARLSRGLLAVPLLLALGIVLAAALLYVLLYRSPLGRGLGEATRAALLLGGAFGNVFYLGYPVITGLYGPQAGVYPALADLLAATPLVWTFGVWIAIRLGGAAGAPPLLWRVLLRLPPLWGFALGAAVNLAGIEAGALTGAAQQLGQATIPVMLFVLGLAIPWRELRPGAALVATAAVKLLAMPAIVWALAAAAGTPATELRAAVLEAGMPTMLMAIVLAERFRLDGAAAALLIGWTTVLFWVILPLWLVIIG